MDNLVGEASKPDIFILGGTIFNLYIFTLPFKSLGSEILFMFLKKSLILTMAHNIQ